MLEKYKKNQQASNYHSWLAFIEWKEVRKDLEIARNLEEELRLLLSKYSTVINNFDNRPYSESQLIIERIKIKGKLEVLQMIAKKKKKKS